MSTVRTSSPAAESSPAPWLILVQQQVQGLRYGVVQIVVHDGRVVQIERTEKTRLDQGPTERKSENLR